MTFATPKLRVSMSGGLHFIAMTTAGEGCACWRVHCGSDTIGSVWVHCDSLTVGTGWVLCDCVTAWVHCDTFAVDDTTVFRTEDGVSADESFSGSFLMKMVPIALGSGLIVMLALGRKAENSIGESSLADNGWGVWPTATSP